MKVGPFCPENISVQTILVPTTPVPLDASVARPGNAFTMSVALNAIPLSAPAGINDILGNYIIAAFDDCGGHINAAQGYHYHAADLSENRIIGCFRGETAGNLGGGGPPRSGQISYALPGRLVIISVM